MLHQNIKITNLFIQYFTFLLYQNDFFFDPIKEFVMLSLNSLLPVMNEFSKGIIAKYNANTHSTRNTIYVNLLDNISSDKR